MLLLLMAIVFIVYLLVTALRRKLANLDNRDSLTILKRRLASGEITLQEFETLGKVL